jgi:hypothetical protein
VAPRLLSIDVGRWLVKLARNSVRSSILGTDLEVDDEDINDILREERGVFTSIYKFRDGKKVLRGCIGYPLPIKPLYKAVIETAREAAFNDPRFPPLKMSELDEVIFEVSILTPPERIDYDSPLELPKLIMVGRDGLLLRYGPYSGLLLPQVPVEYGWSAEEYLINLSMKAGLPPDGYLYKGVEIYRFEAQVFSETEPDGDVIEVSLGSCR